MKKVCFITAIYGNYEKTCKNFVEQTIPTDFICFTDYNNIISNGWIIDTTPYHELYPSPLDDGTYINSFKNNKHTFNIAKYYKQAFQNIPRLKEYEVIIWLDGTIEITHTFTSEWILRNIYKHKIIGWKHEYRKGILYDEVAISAKDVRYRSNNWNNQYQPIQDVENQYLYYINDGYDENYFKKFNIEDLGVWITCFVAFLNNDENVKEFLDLWYLQTLKFTTQDQIGFPYVCQKLNLIPYTLPTSEIPGDYPHNWTFFYKKHNHNN